MLILYSQGYRFNWQERWLSQVGAFYFSVNPSRAEVFVDDNFIGSTRRLLGTVLTENFLPGTYTVRIQKEGFHTWEKRLEIVAKQVTEAKHIILLPQSPAFTVLEEDIQGFWPAPNQREAIVKKPRSAILEAEEHRWVLFLWDAQGNTQFPVYQTQSAQEDIQDIRWQENSNSFVIELTTPSGTKTFFQIVERSALSQNQTYEESLQAFSEFREERLTPDPDMIAVYEDNQTVTWLDASGFLRQQHPPLTEIAQLTQVPFPTQPSANYALFPIGQQWFLQENSSLSVLQQNTPSWEDFFSPFDDLVSSPDGKKLALSSGQEIWLYYLQEEREQPMRNKDERVFLTRFGEPIGNLTWLTTHHILFTLNDRIVVVEIDTRDRLNSMELIQFPSPTLLWQADTKTLFVYSENSIFVSEKLLP
jgi:hypothetical protein